MRIEFTPTFMGCPALEPMQRAMEAKVDELGAKAEVRVVLDDSWSTDKITPEGREKLRAAGFAPPSPRSRRADAGRAPARRVPLPVLRLDGHASRESLRADPVPLDPLLRRLPAAVRAVQDPVSGCDDSPAARLRA